MDFSGGTGDYNVTLTQPDNTTQPDNNNSTGTSTFTVDQDGIYTVDVTSIADGNCTVSGPSLDLTVNALPTVVNVETTSLDFCEDGTVPTVTATFTGATPFTYDNDGAVNETAQSSATTTATLTVNHSDYNTHIYQITSFSR